MKLALVLLFFVISCSVQLIPRNDNRLKEEKGFLLFNGKPYSGKVVSFFDNGKLESSVQYANGQKDGVEKLWYKNGILLAERFYLEGKKEGIHKGWHEGGEIRFYSNFKNDRFEGESWSWYPSGQIESYMKYEDGKLLGHKQWRADGKIYMNYVLDGFERIGLYGGKLCKKVEGDNDGKTVSH